MRGSRERARWPGVKFSRRMWALPSRQVALNCNHRIPASLAALSSKEQMRAGSLALAHPASGGKCALKEEVRHTITEVTPCVVSFL